MRNHRRCRGQNLTELALVLPILIVTMLGIMGFGFIYFARGSVENAAREGARYASIHPADTTGITTRVKQMVTGVDTTSASFQVAVTYPDGDSTPTNRIRVTVSYPLAAFWPARSAGTYQTASTMRIEKE